MFETKLPNFSACCRIKILNKMSQMSNVRWFRGWFGVANENSNIKITTFCLRCQCASASIAVNWHDFLFSEHSCVRLPLCNINSGLRLNPEGYRIVIKIFRGHKIVNILQLWQLNNNGNNAMGNACEAQFKYMLIKWRIFATVIHFNFVIGNQRRATTTWITWINKSRIHSSIEHILLGFFSLKSSG